MILTLQGLELRTLAHTPRSSHTDCATATLLEDPNPLTVGRTVSRMRFNGCPNAEYKALTIMMIVM
jgi:hypothetical protein